MISAVATSIWSHSSTTDVCVAFLQRRTGAVGSDAPKELKIASWRAMNEDCDFCSEVKLRETVISTMLPEEMFGGRRIEGNSICGQLSVRILNDNSNCGYFELVQVFCLVSAGLQHLHQLCQLSMRSALCLCVSVISWS